MLSSWSLGSRGLCTVVLLLISLVPVRWSLLSPSCHKTCVCASNIVSCSKQNLSVVPTPVPPYAAVLDLSFNNIVQLRAEWTLVPLAKLHSLLLGHNGLAFLSTQAFARVSRLRHLDLSCNALRQLDEFVFEPLARLEVLLLYNNRIAQVDRTAFTGLLGLQKLYLSHNQVSRFPVELVRERTRPEKLSLLDVSNNRIKVLPLQELQTLPAWLSNGLYLHSNPLVCDCQLYSLLAHWYLRRLNSAVDFKDEHTCVRADATKAAVGVFQLDSTDMNCSTFHEAEQEAYLEQTLVLSCDTRHRPAAKTWLTPDNVVVPHVADGNHSRWVVLDGSLRLGPLRQEDSGVYTCLASGEAANETLYVLLKVHNSTLEGAGEALNTAYTTLGGCLASVVLVLIYLYLTPCRCFCCASRTKPRTHGEDSIRSSVLSATPTGLARHVAFLDPKRLQGQNGKLEAGTDARGTQGERKKSDAESVSSVFSDTPMVV